MRFWKNWQEGLSPEEIAIIKKRKKRNSWIIFGILVIIRLFFVEHYAVPSSSMTPTLLTGDIILIKKYVFRWSRMSIPFGAYLPFFKIGIKWRKPKHGQVTVFVLPRDPSIYYVKRIVGLAGDYVQMINGVLHINDKSCKMKYVGKFKFKNDEGKYEIGKKYKITLPFAPYKSYFIYRNEAIGRGHIDNTPRYKVPEGHVWVQGDFNTGSGDSFSSHFIGPIPEDYLVGSPFYVIYGTDSRLESEPDWTMWIMQLPYRIAVAIKDTNWERFGIRVD